MYSDFLNDPKMISLSFDNQRHFIFLLCMKSEGILDKKYPQDGMLERVVVRRLGISQSDITKTKETLIAAQLIDSNWQPTNWGYYKPGSDRPSSNIWRFIRAAIFARDDYTCQYCGERGKKLECDHVIPVAKGGSHDEDNLVTSCFKCNRSKRDKLIDEWRTA
jgi:hypothetical protein